MRIADKIFEVLASHTQHVFFVPGGGAMYLVDALGRSGIPHTSAIHEQGAGFMALGYAMYTNKLGVCLTTSGPGATNAITACAAAWTDSVPLLFLTGQAKTETLIGDSGLRTRGVQEIPIIPMVEPITKSAWECGAENCLPILDGLIKLSMEKRRGPTWLSIPLDIQGAEYAE